jgi:hemolysin activation/secretion protein
LEGKDYNKSGIGLWYEFTEPTSIELFQHQTKIIAETSYSSVFYQQDNLSTNQFSFYLLGERNFSLVGNHFLNIKAESAMINSPIPLSTNELLRLGGWNSLRGFNESSLYSNFYYYGTAEYRYLIGEQAFFDVFGQYGQVNNKSLSAQTQVYSVGLGFNFFLPIGLMSFQISNGNPVGNPMKFGDTKIHWGILAKF